MPITVRGQPQDSVKEACQRLGISRQTLLRYMAEGFFSEPSRQNQGRGKLVRYFTADWYAVNEAKLKAARNEGPAEPSGASPAASANGAEA